MTENYVGRCDEYIEVLDGEHGYQKGMLSMLQS